MGVGKRRSTRTTRQQAGKRDMEGMMDEVDIFHKKRGKAQSSALKLIGGSLGQDEGASDESLSDSDSEEAVLDIEDDEEESSEEMDSEEEEEEEEERDELAKSGKSRLSSKRLLRSMQAQKELLDRTLRTAKGEDESSSSEDDDSDGEEEREEEEAKQGEGAWGRNKKTYYQKGDEVEEATAGVQEDDFDAQEEEMEEARRIQSRQAARLADDDFDLDDEDDSEDDEGEEKSDAHAASVLSREEQLAVIEQDAPELSNLLSELKASLGEIKNVVQPTLDALHKKNSKTSGKTKTGDALVDALDMLQHKEGLSFMESKYMLMMSYCCHIVFYLMMKCEGKSVSKHPLLSRLVEIRTYLEKIRPIEKKMNYQIQKLVNQAVKKPDEVGANGTNEDPLQFKPNPKALVSQLQQGSDDLDDEGAAYVPPKIAAVHYSEDADDDTGKFEDPEMQARMTNRMLKQKRHERKKALRNEYVQHLVTELGDQPEELGTDIQTQSGSSSAFAKREQMRMKLRGEQEEELFSRTPLTKMEKKRLQAAKKSGFTASSMSIFDDLGAAEIADFAIDDDVDEGDRGRKGKSEMEKFLESKRRQKKKARAADPLDGMSVDNPRRAMRSGDDDFPTHSLGDRRARYDSIHAQKRARASFDEDEDADAGFMEREMSAGGFDSDDDTGAGYDLYAAAQQRNDAKKLAKRSRKQSKVTMTHPPLEEEQVVGKREINYQIEKNRGLTPRRNKDLKNPRKKHRIKYGKALIRRKGQVQDQRERRDGYGGEATGIKTRVTKSVKL